MQFTLKYTDSPIVVIVEILGFDIRLFEKLPKGKLGYKKQLAYRNITVLYEGNDDMGVHVILSGEGCRQYEAKESLLNLIERINLHEGKMTRIDLALDDFTGDLIPFKKIVKDIISGNIITKWKSSTEITKRDTDGKTEGKTISMGSRSSNTFLRIYDKALEQGIDGIWYRLEIEIKKENAEETQKLLNEYTASKIIKGVLNNYIRIVIRNENESNKSRWKTKPYWIKLINGIDKIRLSQVKEEGTLEKKKEWIMNQVGASLAIIHILDKGTNKFYNEVINHSIANLKMKDINMINRENYKKSEE